MLKTQTLAAIRFGAGLSPHHAAPADAEVLYDSLTREAGPSPYPVTSWTTRQRRGAERHALRQAARPLDGDDTQAEIAEQLRALNTADRHDSFSDLVALLARLSAAPVGFFERLMRFWANHFANQPRGGQIFYVRAAYAQEALRPHVMATFAEMLKAAVLHPAMLLYLDQTRSVGPLSRVGRRQGRGLNENLARELLELHTLGVAGGYTQSDVTQMARLFTGVSFTPQHGFRFDARIAEPGIIEIFGKRYGGRPMTLDHILESLDDLALRSETAEHLSFKLARHFVRDDPDPQLVAHMAASYLRADGKLPALYRAMLEHPSAWDGPLAKTRSPLEMMAASLRALGVLPEILQNLRPVDIRRMLRAPMQLMGELHERVPSPAGYGEHAAYWITPQGLAARVDWAMGLAQMAGGETDPRDFIDLALADAASDTLRRAAAGAETRAQGVGLILASPDFNRR